MRRPSTLQLLAAGLGTVAFASPAAAVTLGHETLDCGDVSSTTAGSGTNTAVTAGQVTYTATDTQDVDLCAEWTAGSESGTVCFESMSTQMPPQEVVNLTDDLEREIDQRASLVEFNDGETGFLMQTIAEVELLLAIVRAQTGVDEHAAPPEGHDVMSSCTYKYVRDRAVIHVVGKTKAGRHPLAQAATIRCRLQDAATGTVLFDQTRTEPGTLARLDGFIVATPNGVVVCNDGAARLAVRRETMDDLFARDVR